MSVESVHHIKAITREVLARKLTVCTSETIGGMSANKDILLLKARAAEEDESSYRMDDEAILNNFNVVHIAHVDIKIIEITWVFLTQSHYKSIRSVICSGITNDLYCKYNPNCSPIQIYLKSILKLFFVTT